MSEFFASSTVQMIAIIVGIIGVVGFLFWLSEWAGGGGSSYEVEHTIDTSTGDGGGAGQGPVG